MSAPTISVSSLIAPTGASAAAGGKGHAVEGALAGFEAIFAAMMGAAAQPEAALGQVMAAGVAADPNAAPVANPAGEPAGGAIVAAPTGAAAPVIAGAAVAADVALPAPSAGEAKPGEPQAGGKDAPLVAETPKPPIAAAITAAIVSDDLVAPLVGSTLEAQDDSAIADKDETKAPTADPEVAGLMALLAPPPALVATPATTSVPAPEAKGSGGAAPAPQLADPASPKAEAVAPAAGPLPTPLAGAPAPAAATPAPAKPPPVAAQPLAAPAAPVDAQAFGTAAAATSTAASEGPAAASPPPQQAPVEAKRLGLAPPPQAHAPAQAQTQARNADAAAPGEERVEASPAPAAAGVKVETAEAVAQASAANGGRPNDPDTAAAAPRTAVAERAPAEAAQPAAPSAQPLASASVDAPPAAHPVRGAPETVANLSAQILKKLGAKTTQFDVQLDPAGLGRVNVRVEIGAEGRISAAMSFDNPQAAAELKARASELQRALQQAGLDVSSNSLSFDVAGDTGGRGGGHNPFASGDQQGAGSAFRGRAFTQALETAGDAAQQALGAALQRRKVGHSNVDVRI